MKLKSWFNIGVLVSILGFTIVLLLIISNGFKLFVSDTFNKSYEIEESFDSIKLDLNEADINIYYSEDGKNIVKTQEKKHQTFDAKVVNGVLVIEEKVNWLSDFFSFSTVEIDLYVNKKVFDKLVIDGSTSNLYIEGGFTFNEVNIDLSTTKINLNDINVINDVYIKRSTGLLKVNGLHCGGNLYIKGSTGDCELTNVVAAGDLTIKGTTCDVDMDGCDAANIYITVSTGHVKGTILTGKTFDIKTSTGSIKHPENIANGICTIKTSTGDVNISYK